MKTLILCIMILFTGCAHTVSQETVCAVGLHSYMDIEGKANFQKRIDALYSTGQVTEKTTNCELYLIVRGQYDTK